MDSNQGQVRGHWSRSQGQGYSAAPFIVYRTAKYSGIRVQALGFLSKTKAYLKLHFPSEFVQRVLEVVQELIVALLFVAFLPLVLVSFCAIQIFHKIKIILVHKYFEKSIICDDLAYQSSDILTSLIWVKGHLDLPSIKTGLSSRINAAHPGLSSLRKCLTNRFGLLVFEKSENHFNIDNHVEAASSKFYDYLITDEPLRELSGYSVLQKYVAKIVSTDMDKNLPPWQIVVASLPSNCSNKSLSLVILRFHKLLLKENAIVKMFLSSLEQKEGILDVDLDFTSTDADFNFSFCEWADESIDDNNSAKILTTQQLTENSLWKDKTRLFIESMTQGFDSLLLDVDSWVTLRRRQSTFNSKLALGKLVVCEASENIFKSMQLRMRWNVIKSFGFKVLQNLRAVFYIPNILMKILFGRRSLGKYALYLSENKRRQISWSKPISSEFIQEICKKSESHSEAVIISAISLALQDYYQENCIQNPKKVGLSLSSDCGQKLIDAPTKFSDISKEVNNIGDQLHSFSAWKQLSLSYLLKYSPLIIPAWMCALVIRKLCNYYPINLTIVNTESSFPHMTFWGHSVEAFTFWRPPMSNLCIAITVVNYAGTFRVAVSSPMKCVDSLVSQRFPQYLNRVAETVGVDRSRIPYSRKSSPASSPPDELASEERKMRHFLFRQESTPKRHNSCQNLFIN